MSVKTAYDELRNELKEDLTDLLQKSKALLNEEVWGYGDMEEDYAINVYQAIKKVRDMI